MRRRWTISFAVAGAVLPWLWWNAMGYGFSGIALLFPITVPPALLFLVGKQDPLVWDGGYVIFPFLSITNAALYGVVGFLVGQLRFTRLSRSGTVK